MATQLEKDLKGLEKLKSKGALTEEEYNSRRAAIMAAAPTTPQKSGGGGIFKWGLFGCLGIMAGIGILVVGLIAIIAIAASGSTDDTEDSGGDVRVALEAGSSGEISPKSNGDKLSKVTILQVADNAQADEFSQPAVGKKYWAVQVEVENVGTSQVTSLDWKLRDSKALEHTETYVSSIGEGLPIYHDLTPGGKVTGWVIFEIDLDAQPVWLRADPNPFLSDDLYFDAP